MVHDFNPICMLNFALIFVRYSFGSKFFWLGHILSFVLKSLAVLYGQFVLRMNCSI